MKVKKTYYSFPKITLESSSFKVLINVEDVIVEWLTLNETVFNYNLLNIYNGQVQSGEVIGEMLFGPIRYYDQPITRGVYKWNPIFEKYINLNINNLPSLVECSINAQQHPRHRNWFLVKHAGLSENDHEPIDWRLWRRYEQMMIYIRGNLILRLIVEILVRYLNGNKRSLNFENWQLLFREVLANLKLVKFSEEVVSNYIDYYLRDFVNLWDNS